MDVNIPIYIHIAIDVYVLVDVGIPVDVCVAVNVRILIGICRPVSVAGAVSHGDLGAVAGARDSGRETLRTQEANNDVSEYCLHVISL
jgi:hypothetical protein